MISTRGAHLLALTLALAPIACSAASSGDAAGVEQSQNACDGRITLPRLSLPGASADEPPQGSVGDPLGVLDERSPTEIWPDAMASYVEGEGLRRKGWTFAARAGERFAVDSFSAGPLSFEVYGPVDGCAAAATFAPAMFESINGWRAPADGTYFVTVSKTLARESDGQLTVKPTNTTSWASTFAMRRLVEDGTPFGHAFVLRAGLRIAPSDVAIVKTTPGDGRASILAVGNRIVDTAGGGIAHVPSFLAVRSTGAPGGEPELLWTPSCNPYLSTLITGDFDGDGRLDALSGHNLFIGQADGQFRCEPTDFTAYDSAPSTAIDLDGDGRLDLVGASFQTTGSGTLVYLRPYFRRGTTWKAGAFRGVTVPGLVPAYTMRTGLADVDGDGKKELVAALRRTDASPGPAAVAFRLPALAPEDDAVDGGAFGSPHVLPLAVAPITTAPNLYEIDNRGPRSFDADGDRRPDLVATGASMFASAPFTIAYGAPSGGFLLPWDAGGRNDRDEAKRVEHLDFDGDGCEDVVLADPGLKIFRGVRCAVHP